MKNTISLTDSAAEHIKELFQKNSANVGFRLSIKKTGCSGYSYVPALIEKINESDIYFLEKGIPIFIDAESISFLKDVVVDYVSDGVGLKQRRLVFINPNEKARCGCGESFTVD